MTADRSDVGSRLRAAREARGLSLREIAARTKISVSALEALECNDLTRLPGGLFSRAFVRTYAKEVGLDPEQAVRDFDEHLSTEGEAGTGERPERERRAAGTSASRAGVGWFGLAITLVLVVVWVGVDRYYNRRAEGQGESRSISTDAPPRPPAAPPMPRLEPPKPGAGQPAVPDARTPPPAPVSVQVPPAGPAGPPAPPAAAPEGPPPAAVPAVSPTPPAPVAEATLSLRLVLAATGDCLVSMSVDGNRVPERLLKAGEKLDLPAGQSIVLTVGDAAALDYTINDAPGRPLGAAGQAVTVVINTTNYKTFLAGKSP